MQVIYAIANALKLFMDTPAFFLGVVALVGLLLQRKGIVDVVQGTMRTIVGLLVFSQGSSIVSGSIKPITDIMQKSWGVQGVFPWNEPPFVFLMQTMAQTIVPTFVLAWLLDILFVRFLKFRAVWLNAHIGLATATMFNVALLNAFGLTGGVLIVVSAVMVALWWCISAQWAHSYTKQFSGDEYTLGHHMTLGGQLAIWIGKFFAKSGKQADADEVKLPGALAIFQDPSISAALSMPIFFLILGALVGIPAIEAGAGGKPWWMYLILQGLTLAAGMTILLFGVRQFLAAIVPAFKGFADTIVPNAMPALDMPVYFNTSPMGTLLGFVGGATGMMLMTILMLVFKSPVLVFPNLGHAFFEPGVEGVFANKVGGGWKASIVSGLVGGVLFMIGVLILMPLIPQLNGQGLQFANIDTGFILAPLFWVFRFIGTALGTAKF
jgi:PTS system ascorbate-specific IIC component